MPVQNILFSPSQDRFNEFLVVNPCLLGPIWRAAIPRRCCSIPEPAHGGIYLQQHPLTRSEIAAQALLFFFFPSLKISSMPNLKISPVSCKLLRFGEGQNGFLQGFIAGFLKDFPQDAPEIFQLVHMALWYFVPTRARWQNERSSWGQEGHRWYRKNWEKGEVKIPVYKNLEFMKFRTIL